MGMFDTVRFKIPLPGKSLPASVDDFQTKDLDCFLEDYTVDHEGLLRGQAGEVVPFTGDMELIGGNCCVFSQGVAYTKTGEDELWVEYQAKFEQGVLVSIAQTRYDQTPAKPLSGLGRA